MNDGAELIYEMVDHHAHTFERMVLARFLLDVSAARTLSQVLLTTHDNLDARSFSDPLHNGLAYVISVYHQANQFSQVQSQSLLQFSVSKAISEGKLAGDAGVAWDVLMQLVSDGTMHWTTVMHCTKTGLLYWLSQRRMQMAIALSQARTWNADKMLAWLRQERVKLSSTSDQKKLDHDIWDAVDRSVADVIRIPTSIPRLNFVTGGGFGRSEGTLIICPTGGGKTVCGTQFTSEWCMQGQKGIYVTTERTQPAFKLSLRMISQQANIPFNQIKDGIKTTALQEIQRQAITRMRESITGKNLRVVHWFDLPNPNDIEQLPTIVDQYAQELGGLDFFILDWLGGALEVTTDPAVRRLTYQRGADLVAETASRYDCASVVMAQAHENARNKIRVTAIDAQENKSLGNNMTNIMGVSAMMDKSVNEAGEGGNYLRDQFWCLSKTRGGEGGLVPVTRKFEYQKFTPRVGISN